MGSPKKHGDKILSSIHKPVRYHIDERKRIPLVPVERLKNGGILA